MCVTVFICLFVCAWVHLHVCVCARVLAHTCSAGNSTNQLSSQIDWTSRICPASYKLCLATVIFLYSYLVKLTIIGITSAMFGEQLGHFDNLNYCGQELQYVSQILYKVVRACLIKWQLCCKITKQCSQQCTDRAIEFIEYCTGGQWNAAVRAM